jgi:hypothetical protein
LATLFKNA